jgi:hypothetical protein
VQDKTENSGQKFEFEATEQELVGVVKDRVLDLIKRRALSRPGGRELCSLISESGQAAPALMFAWRASSGQGGVALSRLSGLEKPATLELLNDGMIVPTTIDSVESAPGEPDYKIRLWKHFEDVHWGKTPSGEIVIYNLSSSPSIGARDVVIDTGSAHTPALKKLQGLLEGKTAIEDSSRIAVVTDNERIEITPIHTDSALVALRQRQQAYPAPQEM